MATPPPLGADRAAEARAIDARIARITARRAEVNDPDRWRLSDNTLDVLDYLRAHPPSRDLADTERRAEVLDGLALTVALERRQRHDQLMLLERAEHEGMLEPHSNAWRPIGELLGITTARGRRGLLARLDRLREQFYGSGVPSERRWRERAGRPPATDPGAPTPATGRDDWLAGHREQLRQVAAVLHERRGHPADAEYQWLDELDEFAGAERVTPAMVTILRYAAATLLDVTDEPVVAALTQLGGLLDAYQRWE